MIHFSFQIVFASELIRMDQYEFGGTIREYTIPQDFYSLVFYEIQHVIFSYDKNHFPKRMSKAVEISKLSQIKQAVISNNNDSGGMTVVTLP